MNVVGTTVHVLDVGLEVVCNIVGDFSHTLQPLIRENIGPVLRDSHEVVLKRVHCVRPGLQMILHLALADTRHPIQITLVTWGIQQGETEWFVAQSLRDSLPPCSLLGSD
uniref:URF 6 n=1 Tax=Halobacterium phage phiH TaxID=169684 RepID=Q38464_BPPHH|nr:unnamed protein product [Halobacterium phage phiH]